VTPLDVPPTLLEMAGGEIPASWEGRSLLAADRDPERQLFAESKRAGLELRALRQGRYKLIRVAHLDRELFYDLAWDPFEQAPLPRDPTGGALSAALAEYAARADSGWHLKLVALDGDELGLRIRVATPGRLVDVRRYAAQQLSSGSAEFRRFALSPDGRTLDFEVWLSKRVAEVVLETEPRDAQVHLEVTAPAGATGAPLFLGNGRDGPAPGVLVLERGDPRLRGLPALGSTPDGVYVRAVDDPGAAAPAAELSPEAIRRLDALGYTQE
jgi:hypothetical protein